MSNDLQKDEDDWLEYLHRARGRVNECSNIIEDEIEALTYVGLDKVAGRLKIVMSKLLTAQEEIHKGAGKAVKQSFHRANESSNNMFRLALAMNEREIDKIENQ